LAEREEAESADATREIRAAQRPIWAIALITDAVVERSARAAPNTKMSDRGTLAPESSACMSFPSGCPANKTARFIYGLNATQQVFGSGFLCVGDLFFRLPTIVTSATGTTSFSLNYGSLPAGGQISAGSTWKFQFRFRDPAAGGANFNLTHGESATFCT
jgi:hypothetical protein